MTYQPLGEDTEDVAPTTVRAETVQARVIEWERRIGALYRCLQNWSPEGYEFHTQQHVTMHEEMMKEFNIDSVELPVLNMFNKDGWKAKLIPYGLWIIGADGRLDLLTTTRRRIITGMGSDWRISDPQIRREAKALTQSTWREVLQ